MQDLQTFIDLIAKGRNIHISILDLDGILNGKITSISVKNTIHSKPFCRVAKSTDAGLEKCLFCKRHANKKAVTEKKCFAGHCSFGIYEAATPVVRQGAVSAIVYVGNYVVDEAKSKALIARSAKVTGVSEPLLLSHLSECEYGADKDEAYKIGELVRDYLLLLLKSGDERGTSLHWLTLKMKNYADEFFTSDISLKHLAQMYHKNEKYMGRIFKNEVGISFNEYCNNLRLGRAAEMISESSEKIIDIALLLGFNNISYFNRMFKGKYGLSPSEYRKERRGNGKI